MLRRICRISAGFMLAFFIVALLFFKAVTTPLSMEEPFREFAVNQGETLAESTKRLAEEKFIKNPATLNTLIFISGNSSPFRPGIYSISASMSPVYILREMRKGSIVIERNVIDK